MTDKLVRQQQIDQSRHWFEEALRQLMLQTPYPQINITMLAQRAGLSRRTFYRHFNSIDAVLDRLIQSEVHGLFEAINATHPRHFQEVVAAYFTYWQQHLAFLQSLSQNQLLPRLLFFMTEATESSILAQLFSKSEPYVYAFAAGGVWNMLVVWLRDGATDSPATMASKAHLIAQHLQVVM